MGAARELLAAALAPLGGFAWDGAGFVAEYLWKNHLWRDHLREEKRHDAYLQGVWAQDPHFSAVAYGAKEGDLRLLLQATAAHSDGWCYLIDGWQPIGRMLARRGHLGLLRLSHARGTPLAGVHRGAVLGGHLSVLRWARLRGCSPADGAARLSVTDVGFKSVASWASVEGSDWDLNLIWGEGKHLYVLWWAFRNDYMQADLTAVVAALRGRLAVLRWAHRDGSPLDSWVCAAAAGGGHLAVLRWARAAGCPWDAWACAYAALGGELEVLQWARARGCPWDRWTCAYATLRDRREVLRWAHANGCPCDCPR